MVRLFGGADLVGGAFGSYVCRLACCVNGLPGSAVFTGGMVFFAERGPGGIRSA